ncbi:MAG: 2-oxoacid:acceptor oxidoreductase subunit alpha [Pseudomonadota bacterium]
MPSVDISVEVCGMAGDGTIAAGGIINAALSRAGFFVLGFDSYPAEIRGFGRCVTHSRIGDEEILALEDRTHVLISLDDTQSRSRIPYLDEAAAVFFEGNPAAPMREENALAPLVEPGTALYPIPFSDLASGASGTVRGRNLTAVGGFAAVFGADPEFFRSVITDIFRAKGEKVVGVNISSFDAGYRYAMDRYSDGLRPVLKSDPASHAADNVMMSGNQAIGKGALDAGVRLYFGYPITPATPIMEYLAKELPKRGGRVVQMEDEISSIGAVLGAFHAGTRAMTATSGPGFALMTELITHGVMAEIPAVIINAQRGGPSTGLPTKTEQSDLHAAVFGGPGDSSRIVIAPTNVSQCYQYTVKSFQLAEKYQVPVIMLTDFYLDNRVENVEVPEASEEDRANGNIFPDDAEKGAYKRYRMTPSGISPRALPGMEGFNFAATGLEHAENSSPNYTPEIHTAMSDKRWRKLLGALADLPSPVEYSSGGRLDLGVIGWGSTFGSIHEAVNTAMRRGLKVGALKITAIFPYHEEVIRAFMARCRQILIPELNYHGQLANLISHLHSGDVVRLNRVTGSPIPPAEILAAMESLLEKDPK